MTNNAEVVGEYYITLTYVFKVKILYIIMHHNLL